MRLNIRNRLILGLSMMLAPLLLILSMDYHTYNSVVGSIKRGEEVSADMHHLSHLRLYFDMAVMPANDYLINGDIAEKKEFERLSHDVETLINTLSRRKGDERTMFAEVREKFGRIKGIAEEIFNIKRPIGSIAGAKLMKEMDALAHSVTLVEMARLEEILNLEHERLDREAERSLRRALVTGVIGSSLMIALAVFVAFIYTNRGIITPIRTIRERTDAIARGDFGARLELKTGDEFEGLSNAVNSMAASLDNLYTRMNGIVEERTKELDRALKMLKEREEQYRLIFETSPDAIWVVCEKKIVSINRAGVELLGARDEVELTGKDAGCFLPPDYREIAEKRQRMVLEEGETASPIGYKIFGVNGREIDIEAVFAPIGYRDKPAVLSIARDITARKKAQDELARERDKLKTIFEAMEDCVYIASPDYDVEYINPAMERAFGPVGGRKCYEYLRVGKGVCKECPNKEVFEGKTLRWEWYSHKNGKTYDVIGMPVKNPDGSISKLEALRDVTEGKRAEAELKQRLEELELFRKVTIRREIRLKELKDRVETLEEELKKP